MFNREWVTLKRDIEVVTIPMGNKVLLREGAAVMVTQALGGDYTVMTDQGYLARVSGTDADALGIYVGAAEDQPATDPNAPLEESKLWEQMKTVYDPEIPVNVVDLGLIYECTHEPLPEGGNRVNVEMTMTAPGCGMGDILKTDVERKLKLVPGVREVNVEIVFDPPWDMSRISDSAKLKLGLM